MYFCRLVQQSISGEFLSIQRSGTILSLRSCDSITLPIDNEVFAHDASLLTFTHMTLVAVAHLAQSPDAE